MALAHDNVAVRELLETAEQCLRNAEWIAAFDALLAAWRGLRASEIAELCEALSERAARGKIVPGKTNDECVVMWSKMFHERSPLGLGLLLADLKVKRKFGMLPWLIEPRIDRLASVRDDPRIGSAVLFALHQVGTGEMWQKVLRRCARGFDAAGDPRIIAQLEEAFERRSTSRTLSAVSPWWGEQMIARLREKPEQRVVPTLPNDLSALVVSIRATIDRIPETTVIETAPAKPNGTEPAALLEQVRASPDDDDLRLVLADALCAVGDPRGELIVLQIRRARGESTTAKTIARERALLRENKRKWLGAITPAVKLRSAVFERGFLERCETVWQHGVQAEIHFQHPEWSTVRSICFDGEARITPAMRSLREVENVGCNALRDLGLHGHPKLERLGIGCPVDWSNDEMEAIAACSADKLPALVHLEISGWTNSFLRLQWIWNAPWAKQLKSIAGVPGNELEMVLDVFATHENLETVDVTNSSGARVNFRRIRGKKTPAGMPGRDGFIVHVRLDGEATSEVDGAFRYPSPQEQLSTLFGALRAMAGIREVTVEALDATTSAKDMIRRAMGDLKNVTLTFPS